MTMKNKVFRTIEEFKEHYFPEYCKKYPVTMRVTEKEAAMIRRYRGIPEYDILDIIEKGGDAYG